MRIFLKLLGMDFRRAIFSKKFLFAVLGYAVLLCLNLPPTSGIENVTYLFALSYNYGFYIFFFLCAAIPYATSFLSDIEDSYLPLLLRRVPRSAFCIARCISVIVSGTLAVAAASVLYLLFLRVQFPWINKDFLSDYSGWEFIINYYGIGVYFPLRILITSLYGGVYALFALLLSTKIKNSFVVLSFPTLLFYFLSESVLALHVPPRLDFTILPYVPAFGTSLWPSLLYYLGCILLVALAAYGGFYHQVRRLQENGYPA